MTGLQYINNNSDLKSIFLAIVLTFVLLPSATLIFGLPHASAAPAMDEKTDETTGAADAKSEEEPDKYARAKKLYKGLCASCHGIKGDGKAYANNFMRPKSRDFTSGLFKYRSTPLGQPPTDEDMLRVTKLGNPGTEMASYMKNLNDDEAMQVINYIKEVLAPDAFKIKPTPYEIGEPPEATPEMIKLGRQIYEKGDCGICHGAEGRGDGEAGWDMEDDWGERTYPANLTHSWELRGLDTVKDLYRSITTGFDGTPMDSYASDYSDDERWALSHYLRSIQIERNNEYVLPVKKVESVPPSLDDPLWKKIKLTDIPVIGKKVFGQSLIPMATKIRAIGLHSETEIAFMFEWSDRKPNRGDDGMPPDSLTLLLPSMIPRGDPSLDKGDQRAIVDAWEWNFANDRVYESIGKEHQKKRKEKTMVRSFSSYKDGLYRLLFIRHKETEGKDDMKFKPNTHIIYRVLVNDGENKEKGTHGGTTAQRKMMLE